MKSKDFTSFSRSTSKRLPYVVLSGLVVMLGALVLSADPPDDPPLKVLRSGLGSGTVTSSPAGINCPGTCEANFAGTDTVTLTASAAAGSSFARWDRDADADSGTTADCTGTSNTCTISMSVARSVRPVFDLNPAIPEITTITPTGIQTYLTTNGAVTNPARFVKALPDEYKQNWILMSRSESLQTGTAESPRILLPSTNSQNVFTIGMTQHSSYPGAHPNAIEYMQWDASQKNFRFHEIVLDTIPAMGTIPARNRGVSIDDSKCSKCHSTQNVLNRTSVAGTAPPGSTQAKNKPNWDAYDSWGGMTPFNRDRIYQGSVEAATFRKIFNPWTWSANDSIRSILEQLKLQPAGVASVDLITRLRGGANDGQIKFAFDATSPVVTEPSPTSSGVGLEAPTPSDYGFNGGMGSGTPSTVIRGGTYVHLRHLSDFTSTGLNVEGRGVQLFDTLGGLDGNVNPQRIADELINHQFATGNVRVDVRPFALAIIRLQPCVIVSGSTVIANPAVSPTPPALTVDLSFFTARNGMMTIDQVVSDTRSRAESLPRRKADIQKLDLNRIGDPYLARRPTPTPSPFGLIQQYGGGTSQGTDTSLPRIRQEVFRRPVDLGDPDNTVMRGVYVDRELYSSNTQRVALMRYFLEPLGVSVDKWSMGVRGRSRTYTFADVFGQYQNLIQPTLETSIGGTPNCTTLINAMNSTILPSADAFPTYTDIQRIFNKSCIECHGGLGYPPYSNHGTALDLSENESPPAGEDRLDRSYDVLVGQALIGADAASSFLYSRITDTTENCPFGLMPCGGPPLSKVDIETIRRWLDGGAPQTRGDPHIVTIDGVPYDFQSAGEFVLLRGPGLEIQARQTPVTTDGPLGPNDHTGLSSCVSVNSAAAVRVGPHRITYQPNLSGQSDPQGMQLRIDGELTTLGSEGVIFDSGGRVIKTPVPGGIQIEAPGGTIVNLTPDFWTHYQLWYLDIDARHARATQGVMGTIAPGNWLPALPDGTLMGPKPSDLHQRYVDLYDKFENAWRVNNENTLFNYATGTSTATFAVDGWPEENPKVCVAPRRLPGGPIDREPLKRLSLEVAQQHCGGLVGKIARANCVNDVMVTGEPIFAQGYLKAEQIERNAPPAAPILGFPERFKLDLNAPVDFTWSRTSDLNGDAVTYKHCVWDVTERFNLHKCVLAEAPGLGTSSIRGGVFYSVWVLLLGILLLVILLWLGLKKKPIILYLVVAVILVGVVVAFYVGRRRSQIASVSLARSVSGLQSGKAYYWKVIAEDGKGGTTESETRRFEIK